MKRTLALLLLLATACTDEPRAQRVLEESGYTDVQITGYAWTACSDHDDYKTGFRAKGPTGKQVAGAVCCGVMKNCTVRIE